MNNNQTEIYNVLKDAALIGIIIFLFSRNTSKVSSNDISFFVLAIASSLQFCFIIFASWLIVHKIKRGHTNFFDLFYNNVKKTKSTLVFLFMTIFLLLSFYTVQFDQLHICSLVFSILSLILYFINSFTQSINH